MVYLIVLTLIVYMFITYNIFINKINKIKQAASSIDIYLMQRFNLIPNLVECVKGYILYEEKTLIEIAKMRELYFKNKNLKEGELLNNEFNRIIALAEGYPELKASEQFLNLQKNLAKMESQLQAARRIYNAEVNTYNNKVKMFPSNIIAYLCRFKEEEYFAADIPAKENININ